MKRILLLIKNHSVSRNALSLIILQGMNALIPLLVVPFLTRVLGVERFGSIAVVLAIIQLAYVLTDYGFSLSSPFTISKVRDDIRSVGEQIGAIFILKFGLSVLSSLAVIVYGLIISPDLPNKIIYLIAPIAIFGQAFQPIWFFQGIEKLKNVTIFMVIVRLFYICFICSIVSSPDDAWLVILGWGMGNILGALLGIWRIYKEGYRVLIPSRSLVLDVFKNSSQFFISRVAVSLHTSASTVLVGAVGGVSQAAQFSVCEQIYKGGQGVTSPINQALYPYMAKFKDFKLFFKIVIIVGFALSIGCILISYFSGELLTIVFGEKYRGAKNILRIFVGVNIINYFSVSFGYPACAATGDVSFANKSVIIGSVLHILNILILFLFNNVNAFTISMSILITETFIMIIRILYVSKYLKLNKDF